jgi:uncharacterized protein YidB (DUF937 family)
MGLLDQLTGILKSKSPQDLLGDVSQFFDNEGGFNNMLDKFKSSGLGDKVDSWVGTGSNEKLSADEVKSALGDESITRVANNLGVSKDEAAEGLSKALPEVISEATPDGRIPEPDELKANLTKAMSS